jgi:4-hydroxymandelate oxidase
MAFAVYDQGAAAPFTGLRLMREYLRSGDCRRALLVVVEQEAVHYRLPSPAAVPSRNIAVALLCGSEGPGALDTLRLRAGVQPGGVGELLAKEIADLSAGREEVTLIAGNGLGSLAAFDAGSFDTGSFDAGSFDTGAFDTVDEVIVAPPGQPCTGTWWELAGGLRAWGASGRRVLLADYEPMLGYLCVSAFDVEAARPNGGRLLCRTTRKTLS